MKKLKKVQNDDLSPLKKKKGRGTVRKIEKKKPVDLSQKKKETIVKDLVFKNDNLADKVNLIKLKNKTKTSLKEEKQKAKSTSKKNKSSPQLITVSKTEKGKLEGISKKATKNIAKSSQVLKQEESKVKVSSKKSKNKDKSSILPKEKKIKSKVISKKKEKAVKNVVLKNEKNKSKVTSKKNKTKTDQILIPNEEEILSKVISKTKKSNLKQVLVPKKEKNTLQVISKKDKSSSEFNIALKEDKNEPINSLKKTKRKVELDSQKENTKPEVKKAKVSAEVITKKKEDIIEEPKLKIKKKNQGLITKKKESVSKDPLKRKRLENYVKALLKVVDTGEQKKRSLFKSEKPPMFLTITCVKVPKAPLHQVRMILPHSMVASNDDIALFVKDIKRGRRRDPEDTVQHYEDILNRHGCNCIKAVIPFNQVKTEYRQFEMRRRLLGTYDHFLCDGRISGHLAHLLGKAFREHRKLPVSIHMDKKNLKQEIDTALKKTSLQIHSTGDTYTTQFATCSMSVDEITDNLVSVIKSLPQHFPGGWKNIRALRIKSPLSLPIPIYMTLKNKNDVEVPVVKPKRPKAYKSVEGELSTFTSNVHVTVSPDGDIEVRKLGNDDSDGNEDNPDSVEDEDEDAENDIVENEDKDENEVEDEEETDDEAKDEDEEENGDEATDEDQD